MEALETGRESNCPASLFRFFLRTESVLAIGKPAGWMLAPPQWDKTSRNLQRELMLSLENRDFWAVSRHVKFIRFVHRLDSETSGVLLLAKSAGRLGSYERTLWKQGASKKNTWPSSSESRRSQRGFVV